MNGRIRILCTFLMVVVLVSLAQADPGLTITGLGPNGSSNFEWLVEVTPDENLYTTTVNGTGGSLAVELAFDVTGSTVVGATKAGGTVWTFDNPGNNPFTSTVTNGIVTDTTTVFASLGSGFFTDNPGVASTVITIETAGTADTTLDWGGHPLLGGTPNAYTGSRIAQAGVNFDGYTGSLMQGGLPCDFDISGGCGILDIEALQGDIGTNTPMFDLAPNGVTDNDDITAWLDAANTWLAGTTGSVFRRGDTNLDGSVLGGDFSTLALGFGTAGLWSVGNYNDDGVVAGSDFSALALNFGQTSPLPPAGASAVPEPSAFLLLGSVLCGLGLLRPRS